jgi:type VI secretion system protein ImpA
MIDVIQLLAPVSGASPCGPDLEDDAIPADQPTARGQQAALYNLDALYSEARRADSDDAVWAAVLNQAVELLGFNKHLRVAVYLCDAAMRRQQLGGLAQSLAVVRGICETWWDDVHPLASTPGGKQSRVNLLSGLGGNSFLAALRNMPFVDRLSVATLKNYESTAAGSANEDAAARDFARSVLTGQSKEHLDESLRLVEEAADHVRWISARIDSEYSPDADVDCGEFLSGVDGKLIQKIESIRRILLHATGASPAALASAAAPVAGTSPSPAQVADTEGFSKSRIRPMLDQIIAYYREHEPSSPVPLLLLRAKRMMDLSFIDLVNDTAGDEAVRKAQQILGTGKEEV